MSERGEITPSQKYGFQNRELREKFPNPILRAVTHALLNTYMRTYHQMTDEIGSLPNTGPALILTGHFSYLDTVALMVADPYWPWTKVPVRQDIFEKPVLGKILDVWGAYPVNRDGNDSAVLRQIRVLYDSGRTVCIAAQGTRSRTGRLGPMDDTVVGLTLLTARRGVPVYPIVEIGAYESLPASRWFDLPRKITVRSGPELNLSPFSDKSISGEQQRLACAKYIQDSIADLLPERNKPALGTPPMWTKADYVKNPNRRY